MSHRQPGEEEIVSVYMKHTSWTLDLCCRQAEHSHSVILSTLGQHKRPGFACYSPELNMLASASRATIQLVAGLATVANLPGAVLRN